MKDRNLNKNWEINCDLGEGVAHESQLYPWIDSASIACGGHFGDRDTIRESLLFAKQAGVKAGAHPSYPDPQNFGRKSLTMSFGQLKDSIRKQVELFLEMAAWVSILPDHLKFHGALYNDAAKNPELAAHLAQMLKTHFGELTVFVPPFSEMESAALQVGLKIKLEIFGDRTYQDNFQLLDRKLPKALLTQESDIEAQLEEIIHRNQLISGTGKALSIHGDTICFHGDNPGILEFLPRIRKKFWQNQS